LGCILLGLSATTVDQDGPKILESKLAMAKFRAMIGDEDFILKIVDEVIFWEVQKQAGLA